jgi:hypothetical protein
MKPVKAVVWAEDCGWCRSEWVWSVKVGGVIVAGGQAYGRRHDAERGGARWCRRCGFAVEVVSGRAEAETGTLWG